MLIAVNYWLVEYMKSCTYDLLLYHFKSYICLEYISQIKQLFLLFYWLNFSQNHVLVWHIHFITIHLFTIDQSILYLSIHSFFIFLAFDFCRFCMAIRFFHRRHNGQWPPTSKDFYPRFYPLHFIFLS